MFRTIVRYTFGLVVVVVLAWVAVTVVGRMSSDAVSMATGLLFGTLAAGVASVAAVQPRRPAPSPPPPTNNILVIAVTPDVDVDELRRRLSALDVEVVK